MTIVDRHSDNPVCHLIQERRRICSAREKKVHDSTPLCSKIQNKAGLDPPRCFVWLPLGYMHIINPLGYMHIMGARLRGEQNREGKAGKVSYWRRRGEFPNLKRVEGSFLMQSELVDFLNP